MRWFSFFVGIFSPVSEEGMAELEYRPSAVMGSGNDRQVYCQGKRDKKASWTSLINQCGRSHLSVTNLDLAASVQRERKNKAGH